MSNAHALQHKLANQHEQLNPSQWPWKLWLRRHHTRNQLRALLQSDPERMQRDLGLHPSDARRESGKFFWQG